MTFPVLVLALLAVPCAAAEKDVEPPVAGVGPSNTVGFIHADVAALTAQEGIRGLLTQAAAARGRQLADLSRASLGVRLADVDGVCLPLNEAFRRLLP
jgi:hypothetical protein